MPESALAQRRREVAWWDLSRLGKNDGVSATLRCSVWSVAAASLLLVVASGVDGAQASCVAPQLSAGVSSAPAGDVVEIRGEHFGTACNDVIVNGTAAGPPLGAPRTDIKLVVVQDDAELQLLSSNPINADDDYTFAVEVTLPAQLHAGPATIRVESEPFTELAFTVAPATDASTSPTTDSVSTSTSAQVVATVGSTTPPSDEDGNSNWPWISAVIGLGLVLAMVIVTRVRMRRQRSIPDVGEDRLN
jgi:hypothetical protein